MGFVKQGAAAALLVAIVVSCGALAGCGATPEDAGGNTADTTSIPNEISAAAMQRPANVPSDFVVTPNGFFHPSCVLTLGENEHLRADLVLERDGVAVRTLPKCDHESYDRLGRVNAPISVRLNAGAVAPLPSPSLPPPDVSGWVESAYVSTLGPLGWISANWRVPSSPSSDTGQLLYYFPALIPLATNNTILQPVLAYYGGAWTIASWNCCQSGYTWHSTPVTVYPGDTLYGYVRGTVCNSSGVCSNWQVYTGDTTTGTSTTLNTSSYGQVLDWGFGGALEVYTVDACGDYAASGSTQFYNIALRNTGGTSVTPSWTSWPIGGTPSCGYGVSTTTTTVTLAVNPSL